MGENISEIKDGLSDSERVALEQHLQEKMLELNSANNVTTSPSAPSPSAIRSPFSSTRAQ